MEKNEFLYPEIKGTEVLQAKSWETIRVITSEKAQQVLTQKGIEIGARYRLFWPKNPDITIAGISDDMSWFDPSEPQERIESIQSQRAAIWGYIGDENQIGFLWYLNDITKKEGEVAWFTMKYNGINFEYTKVEDLAVPETIENISKETISLL